VAGAWNLLGSEAEFASRQAERFGKPFPLSVAGSGADDAEPLLGEGSYDSLL